jgi:tetratricopeptide (TPR) repeat protein
MYLHALSHFENDTAIDGFRQLLGQPSWPQGADLAQARFWEGEAHWVAGDHERAIRAYDLAYELAIAYDATRTAADCARRRVLGQLLTGDRQWIYGIRELRKATQMYEMIGDRSGGHTNSEMGEIYKHLGQLVEAERAFQRGSKLMESANENVRAAHSHLGLADVHRLQRRTDMALEQCDLARMLYRRLEHPWGIVWSTYLASLLGDPWPSEAAWQSEHWFSRLASPERDLLLQGGPQTPAKGEEPQPLMLRYVD